MRKIKNKNENDLGEGELIFNQLKSTLCFVPICFRFNADPSNNALEYLSLFSLLEVYMYFGRTSNNKVRIAELFKIDRDRVERREWVDCMQS